MSAPTIWIIIPLISAILIYMLQRYERLAVWSGIMIGLLLASIAWLVPFGKMIQISSWSLIPGFQINETLTILGRQLILPDPIRPLLSLIYFSLAFWIGGAYAARAGRLFTPVGFLVAGLLTASLAVRPFLYAALIIQVTAILTIPLLSPPGKPLGRGVLRFLTFQTLAMPLILFSGWLLGRANPAVSQEAVFIRAALTASIGIVLAASIFPFHTWIPMVAKEAQPYAAGFVFFIIPTIVSLFSLMFVLEFIQPFSMSATWLALRFLGILMVFLGGVFCAFENHLGRMLGFAAVSEIGYFCLALSLGPGSNSPSGNTSVPLVLAQILPRGVALAVWALALSIINQQRQGLSFAQTQGAARHAPFAAASLVLAQFSLAGVPLLAAFPVRLNLWNALAQESIWVALFALAGGAGMLIGAVRALAWLVTGENLPAWKINESQFQLTLLILGWGMLFLLGLFPQLFLPPLNQIALFFVRVP
jgi:NADH-quinone oxidoreductase subunit N